MMTSLSVMREPMLEQFCSKYAPTSKNNVIVCSTLWSPTLTPASICIHKKEYPLCITFNSTIFFLVSIKNLKNRNLFPKFEHRVGDIITLKSLISNPNRVTFQDSNFNFTRLQKKKTFGFCDKILKNYNIYTFSNICNAYCVNQYSSPLHALFKSL